MGFKFRKRIKLFPGCSINLSKSGASATFGPKGFSVNVGKKGTYLNTSIPGTGLYDRVRLDAPARGKTESSTPAPSPSPSSRARRRKPVPEVSPSSSEPSSTKDNVKKDGALPSYPNIDDAPSRPTPPTDDAPSKYSPIPQTGEKWRTLKSAIVRSQKTRAEYRREAEAISRRLVELRKSRGWTICGIGADKRRRVAEEIAELESRLELLRERSRTLDSLRMNDQPSDVLQAYRRLADAFRDVCRCRTIWNVVNVDSDDGSAFDGARFSVDFNAEATTALDSTFAAFRMRNAQGDSIYVYPTFLVLTTTDDFALIDFADLTSVSGSATILRESGAVPSDAKIVGVERDGNTEIKSAQYFRLSLTSKQGLDETFVFSSLEPARRFCGELANYRRFYASR